MHDLNFLYYPQYLTRESLRYYAGQIEWAVSKATLISADSEHTRRDLLERLHVPPNKVTSIPLAAGPAYSHAYRSEQIQRVIAKHTLPQDFLLFVGTMEPRKNLPLLLEAMSRLPATIKLPLVIVGGTGWLNDEIGATVKRLNMTDHVVHLTNIPDHELAALYHAARLLALPSHYEGFGLPALEAMHCGCPVIVSSRASLPEIVGDAGLILDPIDPDAWAAAIEQVILNNEIRNAMITAGYAQASRFSWDRTARMTLDLFRSALDA